MPSKFCVSRALVVFYLFYLTGCSHSVQTDTQNPYNGPEFRRWSAVVADLDETIYLYTEVLGFQLGSVAVDPKTSYVYDVFNIDRSQTTRHATFDAGNAKRVMSVVEVTGIKADRLPKQPRSGVALINANGSFDKIIAKLRASGYKTLEPHRLGRNGIEVGFVDKDGHMYALYEFPYSGSIELPH